MKCTWSKRFGRVGANFGISFLTPMIGINLSNVIVDGNSIIIITVLQSVFTASVYTALSVLREIQDWSNGTK